MKSIINRCKRKFQKGNHMEGYNIKHFVIELDDLKHLTPKEEGQLLYLLEKTNQGRKQSGKPEKIHIVIDSDKKYSDQVVEVMKSHNDWGN